MPQKRLTVKQTKFVKEYVKNDGNGTKAALATYNTTNPEVANANSVENLQKPSIKQAIEQALVKHQITMDAAVQPIADGLKATRGFKADDDGDTVEVIDHATRLKASGMALKLLGADQKEDGGNTFNFKGNASFDMGKYKK